MNDKETFLMNCYERAFVIYSYDKNLHLAHLENSEMPLKDFFKSIQSKDERINWWGGNIYTMNKIIIYKEGEYQSLPMTESLFWNRVDSLKKALLNSEDFEFRLMWYHKLQELLKQVPW